MLGQIRCYLAPASSSSIAGGSGSKRPRPAPSITDDDLDEPPICRIRMVEPPIPSIRELAAKLGNRAGLINVLFETPSGFAIFCFDGVQLLLPDAVEDIWRHFTAFDRGPPCALLEEFKSFEVKSGAINLDTGVNNQLTDMLKKWCPPGEKLAVGKPEYKTIIETYLKIPCLYDEAVMELMWGLKNLMHSLVPQEKSELTKEDRLQMSQGLNILLKRYGLDVKPEMVNGPIIWAACWLYDCDHCEKIYSKKLRGVGKYLKKISSIDTKNWDPVKFALAMMMITPVRQYEIGDYQKMFSTDELSKLVADKPKYEGMFYRSNIWVDVEELVYVHEIRTVNQNLLRSFVEEAKYAHLS